MIFRKKQPAQRVDQSTHSKTPSASMAPPSSQDTSHTSEAILSNSRLTYAQIMLGQVPSLQARNNEPALSNPVSSSSHLALPATSITQQSIQSIPSNPPHKQAQPELSYAPKTMMISADSPKADAHLKSLIHPSSIQPRGSFVICGQVSKRPPATNKINSSSHLPQLPSVTQPTPSPLRDQFSYRPPMSMLEELKNNMFSSTQNRPPNATISKASGRDGLDVSSLAGGIPRVPGNAEQHKLPSKISAGPSVGRRYMSPQINGHVNDSGAPGNGRKVNEPCIELAARALNIRGLLYHSDPDLVYQENVFKDGMCTVNFPVRFIKSESPQRGPAISFLSRLAIEDWLSFLTLQSEVVEDELKNYHVPGNRSNHILRICFLKYICGEQYFVRLSQDNWHRILDNSRGDDYEILSSYWKNNLMDYPLKGRYFDEQCKICAQNYAQDSQCVPDSGEQNVHERPWTFTHNLPGHSSTITAVQKRPMKYRKN